MIENLASRMGDAKIDSDEWTDFSDVYTQFIRSLCFRATVTSVFGTSLFKVNPTFEDDFWFFDTHLPGLFKEMPKWLVPDAFKSRDTMKEHVKKWHRFANEHYDVANCAEEPREWEEYFGSRLVRTRQAFFTKMPISEDTIAADDLGLIWGFVTSILCCPFLATADIYTEQPPTPFPPSVG